MQGKTAGQGELHELEMELTSEAKAFSAGEFETTVRDLFMECSDSGNGLSDLLRLGALASNTVWSLVCQAFFMVNHAMSTIANCTHMQAFATTSI